MGIQVALLRWASSSSQIGVAIIADLPAIDFEPPNGVIHNIHRILRNFLWGSAKCMTRRHWLSWTRLCQPKKVGGLVIRSLFTTVQSFSCKLWWRFRMGGSLWSDFMRVRYCNTSHPNQVQPMSGRRLLGRGCSR